MHIRPAHQSFRSAYCVRTSRRLLSMTTSMRIPLLLLFMLGLPDLGVRAQPDVATAIAAAAAMRKSCANPSNVTATCKCFRTAEARWGVANATNATTSINPLNSTANNTLNGTSASPFHAPSIEELRNNSLSGWSFVVLPGTACSVPGTPWGFLVRLAPAEPAGATPVLVDFVGGGACWDYFTCGAMSTSVQTLDDFAFPAALWSYAECISPADVTQLQAAVGLTGILAHANESLFATSHHIVMPYCTGDVGLGNATVAYHQVQRPVSNSTGGSCNSSDCLVVQHVGAVNNGAALSWILDSGLISTATSQIAVVGDSAGAVAATVWGAILRSALGRYSGQYLVWADGLAGVGAVAESWSVSDGAFRVLNAHCELLPACAKYFGFRRGRRGHLSASAMRGSPRDDISGSAPLRGPTDPRSLLATLFRNHSRRYGDTKGDVDALSYGHDHRQMLPKAHQLRTSTTSATEVFNDSSILLLGARASTWLTVADPAYILRNMSAAILADASPTSILLETSSVRDSTQIAFGLAMGTLETVALSLTISRWPEAIPNGASVASFACQALDIYHSTDCKLAETSSVSYGAFIFHGTVHTVLRSTTQLVMERDVATSDGLPHSMSIASWVLEYMQPPLGAKPTSRWCAEPNGMISCVPTYACELSDGSSLCSNGFGCGIPLATSAFESPLCPAPSVTPTFARLAEEITVVPGNSTDNLISPNLPGCGPSCAAVIAIFTLIGITVLVLLVLYTIRRNLSQGRAILPDPRAGKNVEAARTREFVQKKKNEGLQMKREAQLARSAGGALWRKAHSNTITFPLDTDGLPILDIFGERAALLKQKEAKETAEHVCCRCNNASTDNPDGETPRQTFFEKFNAFPDPPPPLTADLSVYASPPPLPTGYRPRIRHKTDISRQTERATDGGADTVGLSPAAPDQLLPPLKNPPRLPDNDAE